MEKEAIALTNKEEAVGSALPKALSDPDHHCLKQRPPSACSPGLSPSHLRTQHHAQCDSGEEHMLT